MVHNLSDAPTGSQQAPSSGQPHQSPTARALSELVSASWRGLMSTLQLLALNQAGFRPLTAEVRVAHMPHNVCCPLHTGSSMAHASVHTL